MRQPGAGIPLKTMKITISIVIGINATLWLWVLVSYHQLP
jgi:hypothetical protein